MSYKISDATMKQLRRLPEKHRIIAEQAFRKEVGDAVTVTADSCVLASAIVLMEEFKFGANTKRPDSRMKHYFDALNELIDFSAKRYGDAMAEALRKRLKDLGIEYESR
jgi:hypothetical protein